MDRVSVDAKVLESIRNYARFPQTLKIFVAGGEDNHYVSLYRELGEAGMLDKLVLLSPSKPYAPELQNLHISTSVVDFLRPIDSAPLKGNRNGNHIWASSSLSPVLLRSESSSASPPNGQLYSGPITPTLGAGTRLINPDLPLHHHSPPPCNEFYLMSCNKGAACKYSHDYLLSPEQLTTLAKNAKKAPCNYIKRGQPCPLGDRCCWGHVCPKGAACFHFSKGKCWFKSDDAHEAPNTLTP